MIPCCCCYCTAHCIWSLLRDTPCCNIFNHYFIKNFSRVGSVLKIKTGLTIEMRWFRKKRFFFLFYGEHAARTRLFFKILYKNKLARAKITLITMMEIWPTFWQTVNYLSLTKRQSEGSGLKPSISRVFCFNPERFSSISRHATRPPVEAFFLPPLHRGVRTKAVLTKR